MATNQELFVGIYEGIVNIFFKSAEVLEAFDVVTVNTDAAKPGTVIKCGLDARPYGFSSQTVTATGVENYAPGGLITRIAKVGRDPIGVYVNGGILKTKAAEAITAGLILYPTAAGKLTATVSTAGIPVAIAETAAAVGNVFRFKSLL